MTFRPNCTDETRSRLTPFRGDGSWDRAITRAIVRAEDADNMALFIEAIREEIDTQGSIDSDLFYELRGEILGDAHFKAGDIASIPTSGVPDGWRECDGENGTPDLRLGRWMMREAEHGRE